MFPNRTWERSCSASQPRGERQRCMKDATAACIVTPQEYGMCHMVEGLVCGAALSSGTYSCHTPG